MNSESNLTDLLKELREDATTLVRGEVALAKAEMAEKVSVLTRNGARLFGGALLGYAALTPLLGGLGFLLKDWFVSLGWSEGVSVFSGLTIVALITGALSAIIVLNALSALKNEKLLPRKTIASLKEDREMIQNKLP
jgi:hypothetical protein